MTAPRRLLAAVIVLASSFALAAAPAAADDAAVKAAWDSQDPAFTKLGKQERRAFRAWEKRGFTRDGRLLRLQRRGERLCGKVLEALNAAEPSTPDGAQARDLAIASVTDFAAFFRAERRFVRRMRPSEPKRALRAARKASRLHERTIAKAEEALAIFERLGIE